MSAVDAIVENTICKIGKAFPVFMFEMRFAMWIHLLVPAGLDLAVKIPG